MEHVRGRLGCSERRVCRILGLARSTWKYQAKPNPERSAMVARLKALSAQRPRFGQDRITVLLRKDTVVNHKRVERIDL